MSEEGARLAHSGDIAEAVVTETAHKSRATAELRSDGEAPPEAGPHTPL